MLRELSTSLARQPWIRKAAVSTPGVRDLAWRFVAGETLEAGLATTRALNARGIKATLTCVGTHVRAEEQAVAAASAAVASLERIVAGQLDANISIKLTQIGLDIDEELCRTQLGRVVGRAAQLDNFVWIDLEESRYVPRTLRLFEEAREAYGIDAVGIVVQSYLRDRAGDLERLLAGHSRIRLVKGGYWEPAEVVYRRRTEIDRAFLQDIDLLLARGYRPAIATHDERAVRRACDVAAAAGLDKQAFEFQMLYGVREDLQERLVGAGYPVRSYVPYGDQWYEYLLGCIRRIPGGAFRRLLDRLRPGDA